jgi:serine/threonine protein phosphatase PrpC
MNQQILDCEINTELAGSTLVAVFIYNQKILTFNVGDSRAILLQGRKEQTFKVISTESNGLGKLSRPKMPIESQWSVIPLSVDQKPERPDEKQRILKFGGRVFAQTNEQGEELGPARVWMKDVMMPGLAMTRSFGDKAGIKSGTNAEPELTEHEI